MHLTNPEYSNYDFLKLINAMMQSDDMLNLSQNPWLPLQVGKLMHWPVMGLLFMAGENPVAWFAAVNTGREWFAVPHFNNGSFWLDTTSLQGWLNEHLPDYQLEEKTFFNNFINKVQWFKRNSGNDQLWVISLEPRDFDPLPELGKSQPLLRHRCYLPLSPNTSGHKTDSLLRLENTVEQQWLSFHGQLRYKIGKCQRNGIEIRIGGIELLHDFYKAYRINIHHLGSMGLPEVFFKSLLEKYPGGISRVLVAFYKNEPVGSAIMITWLHFAENPWFATLRPYNRYYVSYLLHWEMIKLAIGDKCRQYSFGHSSKGSGVHRYKQQWGAFDRTIYMNSNEPVSDSLNKMQYLRHVIRLLPLSWVKQLDAFAAGRYY